MTATREELVSYIRQSAEARGIDPDVAVAVANSEGLNADPAEGWQSTIVKDGVREPSYGPFQLYMGGGLGNEFAAQTGLDPRDPETVFRQIDFSLDKAAEGGWSPWYGARAIGLGSWEGIGQAPDQTPEARRAQYGLGDRDPGNAAEIIGAVSRGDMTKDEAQKFVSEELLEGIEGGSAYDQLQEGDRDQASLGVSELRDLAALTQQPQQSMPSFQSLSRYGPRLSGGRPSATSGTQALKRMGVGSLLSGNPLLGMG